MKGNNKNLHEKNVVIEKAGNNWSAYVNDLPGCVATGRTESEAYDNIRKAIEMHLKGLTEDKEWQLAKFISKYKAAFPERPVPNKEVVERWLDEMVQNTGHITYPMAGEKWNQVEWRAQYRFGKTIQSFDVDIAGYSACAATDCKKKLNCKRGLLYLYMVENDIIGHTVLRLNGQDNCERYIPHSNGEVR